MSVNSKNFGSVSIETVGFSVRTYNCLKHAKLLTLGDIAAKTKDELWKVRDLGKTALEEITGKLNEYGMALKGER